MTKPFAKLMSYNQIDFQSKFHMDAMVQQMESVNEQKTATDVVASRYAELVHPI